jgi:hypothetical protein
VIRQTCAKKKMSRQAVEEDLAALARIEKRWSGAEARHAAAFVPEEERKKTARARVLAERLGKSVRTVPVERLVAENPGQLADDITRVMRDLKYLEVEQSKGGEIALEARKAASDVRQTLHYYNSSPELDIALGQLVSLQKQIAELVQGELDYLRDLRSNSDNAANIATTHLDDRYRTIQEDVRVQLNSLFERRLRLERAYLRERAANELRIHALVKEAEEADERMESGERLRNNAVRLHTRLQKIKVDLVEKLEYEAKGGGLLDEAVDEQEIEARCTDSKTKPEYRSSAVCKAAASWSVDVSCTPSDTGKPTSALTGDEVAPKDRIRLRFKRITGPAGAGSVATVTRCFDIASLKYMIAINRADGVEVLEPESKLPLSRAQLRRIDALEWPASSDRVKETIDELLALVESKTRTLEVVQRRQELARRLVWLRAGSPGLDTMFPDADATTFVYSDDGYWWSLAETALPRDLRQMHQPPISTATRRQTTYQDDVE